jgi:prepilin-type N-terminal cleavage/methylation domain-containing protein
MKLKRENGFTLIELLIVVAIIMVINVVIVSFFITTESKARIGSQSINRVGLARSALNLMTKDIRASTGILPSFLGYKTSESCLILNGNQTIVYVLNNNVLERIVYSPSLKRSGMKFTLIKEVDSIHIKFDTPNLGQVRLITVTLSCAQDKYMVQNIYTLTAVTKVRNK